MDWGGPWRGRENGESEELKRAADGVMRAGAMRRGAIDPPREREVSVRANIGGRSAMVGLRWWWWGFQG